MEHVKYLLKVIWYMLWISWDVGQIIDCCENHHKRQLSFYVTMLIGWIILLLRHAFLG